MGLWAGLQPAQSGEVDGPLDVASREMDEQRQQ
jgi:hypothetical protein